MRLTFLGTSAGTPTRERNVTCQAVELGHGPVWLLDCGEGTQHQAMRVGLKTARISRILITHLHGDHCLGLPGMLAHIAISGRTDPVEVLGPPGLREYIDTVHRLTAATIPYPLALTELPLTGADLPAHEGWAVAARPLIHRVPCLGYALSESARPGRFHADRADHLGVPPRLRGQLQQGRPVTLDDGRVVEPGQVADPPRPGRKLVLLGDTSDPEGIAAAAQDCDLLVCEATYDGSRAEKARTWGHMTAPGAGAFAARVRARALAITHFSSRYGDGYSPITCAHLVAEAEAACPGTPVWPAQDLQGLLMHANGRVEPALRPGGSATMTPP